MFRWGVVGVVMVMFPAGLMAQGIDISVSAEGDSGSATGVEISGEATETGETGVGDLASSSVPVVDDIPEGFEEKLDYGHSLYFKGDFAGALKIYSMAKKMKTSDPLVLYFVACTEMQLTHYDAALSALSAMKTLSAEKLPSLTAKALFLTAMTQEMKRDDEGAAATWNEYKTYLSSHAQLPGFAASADSRLEALQKKRELYQQYEVVRQRISAAK